MAKPDPQSRLREIASRLRASQAPLTPDELVSYARRALSPDTPDPQRHPVVRSLAEALATEQASDLEGGSFLAGGPGTLPAVRNGALKALKAAQKAAEEFARRREAIRSDPHLSAEGRAARETEARTSFSQAQATEYEKNFSTLHERLDEREAALNKTLRPAPSASTEPDPTLATLERLARGDTLRTFLTATAALPAEHFVEVVLEALAETPESASELLSAAGLRLWGDHAQLDRLAGLADVSLAETRERAARQLFDSASDPSAHPAEHRTARAAVESAQLARARDQLALDRATLEAHSTDPEALAALLTAREGRA